MTRRRCGCSISLSLLTGTKGYVAEFGRGRGSPQTGRPYRPFYNAAARDVRELRGAINHHETLPTTSYPAFMPALSFPDQAMYVRGHNGFNDFSRKNARPIAAFARSAPRQETLFKDRFAIRHQAVRAAFFAKS